MKRALGVLTVLATVAWVVPHVRAPQVFPHARHEGLFPTCTACHEGIPTGDSATFFPDSSVCTACHNGTVQKRITWWQPKISPSNLRFTHRDHPLRPEGSPRGPTCLTCHREPGAAGRMSVGPADPDACLACHRGESHLARGRDCLKCHVPVTEAKGLSAEDVAHFPKPAWHGDSTFLTSHAPTVEEANGACAVCHTQESCERCHLNAKDVAPIAALGRDARVAAALVGRAPVYPRPPSHRESDWSTAHGAAASGGVGECANCHVRENCRSCHRSGGGVLDELPVRPPGDLRGVHMGATAVEVHPAGWTRDHGVDAADGGATCASCHAQDFCVACHAGQTTPRFHPPNFLQMHGPDAYGADVECVSCHNTESFCRTCHMGAGLASRSRLHVAFHTANPNWLVGHGQAARQGLQGCVTCHSESDCMQCHSAVGGWGINPHGPDFDPSRLRSVAPLSCLPCHSTGIPGGEP